MTKTYTFSLYLRIATEGMQQNAQFTSSKII
jgi:hypothetical protein